jgi:beta-phosphoglucomutase-like phosphatase (HAD superfamily)
MRYRGILFDFNGVLCWDTSLQVEAWDRYALELRSTRFTPEELREHVIGRSNRHILTYLTGRRFQGAELTRHSEAKESIYRQLCLERAEIFRLSPGATELLDALAVRDVRRNIASMAGKENFRFYFEHLGLERWFRFEQVIYDDDHIAAKPAPDAYLRAAERIGLSPEVCVVVEDSRHGIEAARRAGAGFIIALGPAEQHGKLRKIAGVGLVVENLGQVPVESLFSPDTHRSQSKENNL